MTVERTQYLLTIRGTQGPATIDAARGIHNETAGAPQSVAAARSLGDLSHMVYVPFAGKSEILFMDVWNRAQGIQDFFANPIVQEQGGRMFSSREATVWKPAEGFHRFALPSPSSKSDRYVGLIRGTAKSLAKARECLDAMSIESLGEARKLGLVSHDVYVRVTPPGAAESLEILGVDTWNDGDGMAKFYQGAGEGMLADIFTGAPDPSMWKHPAGTWVEW